jgi:uncharacterized membrane protein YidH (DUF202 family)
MKKAIYPALLFALPFVVDAQTTRNGITGLLQLVQNTINAIIPIIIGLAVLVFLWGLLSYVVSKDADRQKEARGVMIWGIIAIFVMVSVWGLVGILNQTIFGANGSSVQAPNTPQVPQAR